MDFLDFVLSCCPPLIAVVLQRWGIPPDRNLENLASKEATRVDLPVAELLENSFKGLIAENGLAAMIVSFPSGVFAIAHLGHNDSIWTYAVLAPGFLMIVILLYMISGSSPRDMAVGRIRYSKGHVPHLARKLPFLRRLSGKHFFPFSGIDAIRWVVYVLNGFVILLALSTYIRSQVSA